VLVTEHKASPILSRSNFQTPTRVTQGRRFLLAAAHGIVKNHPFVDGSNRTGFLMGMTFLPLNGLRLTASESDATQTIVGLAAGEISEAMLAAWFEHNTIC